jgi:uncharacterized membrane protein
MTSKAYQRRCNQKSGYLRRLRDAGFNFYPPAYFAMIGFIFLIFVGIIIPIVILTGLLYLIPLPLIVILLGYVVPQIMARDRAGHGSGPSGA